MGQHKKRMVTVGFARYINADAAEGPYNYELIHDVFNVDEIALDFANVGGTAYYNAFYKAARERGETMRFWSTGKPENNEPKYLIFVY